MQFMQVMRFNDAPHAAELVPGKANIPSPSPRQLLIRVYAVGVTPSEARWYPTMHTLDGSRRIGAIPGHEFSGVVVGVGDGIDPSQIGREVFGMNDWFEDGATAEYCLADSESVATKPFCLSHFEAASVPIGALTAWQGVHERAQVKPGERVLVHGGAGAVGHFAVQFAKRAGAHVIATASARSLDFLKRIGADEAVDYRMDRFESVVGNADVVFDTVGGDVLRRSWGVLSSAGRMVTVAADWERGGDPRIDNAYFVVKSNRRQLTEIAVLLDRGAIQCCVDAVVPFAGAPAAFRGTIPVRLRRGKMVVSIVI